MPPGVITADVIRVRPDPARVVPEWLACALNHEAVQAQVRMITGGVTRPKVTLKDFRALRVPAPSLIQQRQAGMTLAAADARIRAEELYLAKLKLQKQGLMQDLLTGRVRVKA